jgi:hypothetical protein|tara:strand:- start:6 stop:131 length:126 start_codon:yes stop_codon:yes gene_type:complete
MNEVEKVFVITVAGNGICREALALRQCGEEVAGLDIKGEWL